MTHGLKDQDMQTEFTITEFFEILRTKWEEVPGGDVDRCRTTELLKVDDDVLYRMWQDAHHRATTGDYFNVRGWYQTLYKDVLRGKRVLDVGCGIGIDGIYFAQNGVSVTFLDLVKSNLSVVSRLCRYLGLYNTDFFYLDLLNSLDQWNKTFDMIWCQGSLINAPFDIMKHERKALLKLLPPGGRWIELAYPKSRWEKEGKMSFNEWGKKTDGGAPWIEWYDLEKLTRALSPIKFDVVLEHEFYQNNFIWFDLLRRA